MGNMRSVFQPKYVGWTLFFLSLIIFFTYHIRTFSAFEDALYQGRFLVR
jgi:hypothetical protein